MVLRIEVPRRSEGFRPSIATWCSFMGPFTPVGSIKSKSISQSSNERPLHLTISPPYRIWRSACWRLNVTTKRSPNLSSGDLHGRTSQLCYESWAILWRMLPRKYVTEHMKRCTKLDCGQL